MIGNVAPFNPINAQKMQKKNVSAQTPRFTGKSTEEIARSFDFNGYNPPLKILLTYIFGIVLLVRLLTARDETERKEILKRDPLSMCTIVFAVPLLKKLSATSVRKSIGLPMATWGKGKKNLAEKVWGHIKPAGNYNTASFDELQHWYGNINQNKKPLVDFCAHHNQNQGNLWKIFQFADKNSKKELNNIAQKLGFDKKAPNEGEHKLFFRLTKFLRPNNDKTKVNIPKSNTDIIEMFNKAEAKKSADISIKKSLKVLEENLSKSSKNGNNILKVAEFFKSVPDLTSIVITALCLGVILPKMIINSTRKDCERKEKEKIESLNSQNYQYSTNFRSSSAFSVMNSNVFSNFQTK